MKKYFNIKKISMMFLTVICIFFTMKNVEAKDKYVCYYVEPHLDVKSKVYSDGNFTTNRNSKLYIQMTYENGRASFAYYEANTKTTHYLLTYDSSIEMSISPKSGNQLTLSDFSNGCPLELERMSFYPGTDGYVYDIFKSGTEEYTQFRKTKLKKSVWTKVPEYKALISKNNGYCYSDELYDSLEIGGIPEVICNKVTLQKIKETEEPKEITSNVLTCEYVDEGILKEDGTENKDLNAHIILKINKKKKTITGTDKLSTNTTKVKAHFKTSDITNSCPSNIYKDQNVNNSTELYLNSKDVPSKNFSKLSNIKKIVINEGKTDKGKTGCQTLGGLVKYLNKIYTFMRFIVPILIIVLSVIDFIGVVLSGEIEKMEKAKRKFATRLIVGFLILIVPAILELLLRIAGILEAKQTLVDATCNIF